MRSKCLKAFMIALLLAGLGGSRASAGQVIRVYYDGIPGTTIANLKAATNSTGQVVFPAGPNVDGSPLQSDIITSVLEGAPPPAGTGFDNFGDQMQGFLEAPQTGAYTFWVAGDDAAEFWLSTNNVASNAVRVAYSSAATGYREWTKSSTQKSAAINLVSGKQYYFQVLHKEGSGTDHVSVGWTLPDGTLQRPLSCQYVQQTPLSYYGDPVFLVQPADVTVEENSVATLPTTVNVTPPASYQWFKGATPVNGGVLSSYSFKAKLSDNGSQFKLQVTGAKGVLLSRAATVWVVPDSTAPSVKSATAAVGNPLQVTVTFSEPVDPITASDAGNYALDNGAMVYAVMVSDATTVQLYTSELTVGTTYNLTAAGVKDLATIPNMLMNGAASFKITGPVATWKFYANVSGTGTNDALGNANYKNDNYTTLLYEDLFEAPSGYADNYIGQLQAYLTPEVTGDYVFFLSSDDLAVLFLSTDDNPANRKIIAYESAWSNSRNFVSNPGGSDLTAKRSDKYTGTQWPTGNKITLTAGQKYYIEAVNKEGGGGDNLSVAWTKPGDAAMVDGTTPIGAPYLSAYNLQFGSVTFAAALKNASVAENASVTFSAGKVTGTLPIFYQWYKNGTAIAGGTNSSYSITSAGMADNQSAFTVLVRNSFSMAASANAILTVVPDKTPATVVAAAFVTNTIGVTFNKAMQAVDATNAANYQLKSASGSAVAITGIKLVDSQHVTLSTANLTGGSAYNLTVGNIKDQTYNQTVIPTTTLALTAFNYGWAVIGTANNQASFAGGDGNKPMLIGGGDDIWNAADGFVYAFTNFTGNFDYKIRVESIVQANEWTKSGIMVRESLDPNSRYVDAMATATGGQNKYVMNWRETTGGASSDVPNAVQPAVSFPNTWIRMLRIGNVLNLYYGKDGVNWTQYNTKDTATMAGGAFTNKVYVGIALTSHNTAQTATSTYSGFGEIPKVPVAFTVDLKPALSVDEYTIATFSVTAAGSPPMTYQWQVNGANVPGATNATWVTPRVTMNYNGAKVRVVVTTPWESKTSTEATVTVVADTKAPAVVAAAALNGAKNIVVKWDALVDTASAATPANYQVVGNGYPGSVTSISLRPDGVTAILAVNVAVTTNVAVITKNVSDLAGNLSATTNFVKLVNMISQDIGTANADTGVLTDPVELGATYPTSATDFEVIAGGSDIWNNADGFHFTYTPVVGDFDVRVRVASLQMVDNWTKAGLMVREVLNGGSRNLNMVVDPASPGSNLWEQNYRAVAGGVSAGWPGSSQVGPVTYPNAWIRLVRMGNTFYALRSTDGIIWETRGTLAPSPAYPDVVYVGMVATSHNNGAGKTTEAKFNNFELGQLVLPSITSVVGAQDLQHVTVTFTDQMTPATATDLANYAFDKGLVVTGAKMDPSANGFKVILTTSTQTSGVLYALTANNIKSTSGFTIAPNTIAAFSGWVLSRGAVARDFWDGINSLAGLSNSPAYPNNPTSTSLITSLEAPSGVADNYCQRLSAYLVPPVSGDYTFFVCSDDGSALFLSTDDNPANKKQIAMETAWSNGREFTSSSGGSDLTAKRSDKYAATQWPTGNKITLTAGKTYYIEALMAEGGGGDNLSVAWTLPGSSATPTAPIPGVYVANYANPDLSLLSITTQPKSVNVEEGNTATLTAAVFSQPASVLYQWQVLGVGAVDWSDIYGANGASYTTPNELALTDSGVKYRVVVYNPGSSQVSDVATVTVVQDTTPPAVVSAAGLPGSSSIAILFSEKMDPASATNPDNYLVIPVGELVPGVLSVQMGADLKSVVLMLDRSLTNKAKIFIQNLEDRAGNPLTTVASTKLINLTAIDVGTPTNPLSKGKVVAFSNADFDITAGGSDIWDNADGFQFTYKPVTGDFDMSVRVARVDLANNWTKAGLMAREKLTPGSRVVDLVVDPAGTVQAPDNSGTGANVYEPNYRATENGSSASWGNVTGASGVPYPNAWLRLTRVGNTFTAYRGNDGVNWSKLATISPTPDYPATLNVGLCTTAHNNDGIHTAFVQYRSFSLKGPGGSLLKHASGGDGLTFESLIDDPEEDNDAATQ